MAEYFACEDEWYPVITLIKDECSPGLYGKSGEFSPEEIADIRRVEKEFNDWQKLISRRFYKGEYAARYSLIYER